MVNGGQKWCGDFQNREAQTIRSAEEANSKQTSSRYNSLWQPNGYPLRSSSVRASLRRAHFETANVTQSCRMSTKTTKTYSNSLLRESVTSSRRRKSTSTHPLIVFTLLHRSRSRLISCNPYFLFLHTAYWLLTARFLTEEPPDIASRTKIIHADQRLCIDSSSRH
jgi:hypothetical protein